MDLSGFNVRLARKEEYTAWRDVMDKHHYLGFKRFFASSLRYIIENENGAWVGLCGWQHGVLVAKPRDDWIGWDNPTRLAKTKYIINNTRCCLLGDKGQYPNLGSWAFSRMFKRLSADWETLWGHPVYIAESFVDISRFDGALYKAAGWQLVGHTKGYSKKRNADGVFMQKHGQIKQIYVKPLRKNAKKLLKQGH